MCAIFHNLKMNAIFYPLKLMTNDKVLPMRVSWCENKKKRERNQPSTVIPSKDSSMGAVDRDDQDKLFSSGPDLTLTG